MPHFIEVTHVIKESTAKEIFSTKETTELVSINIDKIEFVLNIREKPNLITIAKGYIKTSNRDFKVIETREEIMEKVRQFDLYYEDYNADD